MDPLESPAFSDRIRTRLSAHPRRPSSNSIFVTNCDSFPVSFGLISIAKVFLLILRLISRREFSFPGRDSLGNTFPDARHVQARRLLFSPRFATKRASPVHNDTQSQHERTHTCAHHAARLSHASFSPIATLSLFRRFLSSFDFRSAALAQAGCKSLFASLSRRRKYISFCFSSFLVFSFSVSFSSARPPDFPKARTRVTHSHRHAMQEEHIRYNTPYTHSVFSFTLSYSLSFSNSQASIRAANTRRRSARTCLTRGSPSVFCPQKMIFIIICVLISAVVLISIIVGLFPRSS